MSGLRFRIRLGLRLLGLRLRAIPAWFLRRLGLGASVREPPYQIRVIGPLADGVAATDEQLLEQMRRLAPAADEAKLRSLLASLPSDRGLLRPSFPLETYQRTTSSWRARGCEWLQGAVLDRRPTLRYLEARHGGSEEAVPEPPPFLLVQGRPESAK